MARARLATGVLALLVVCAGVGAAVDGADAFADVLVGDVVIGEPEQPFPGARLVGFGDAADPVVLEIDLSVLEAHGVDVGDATVELAADAVRGGSVETAAVEAGVLTLAFSPADANEDGVIEIDEFRLTGLDTAAAEAAAGLTFEAGFSAGEARVRSFDVIDPDRVTPSLETSTLYTDASTHRVTLHDVQATGGNVTVELDAGVLTDHGIDIGALEAEVTADGAAVSSTTVDGGVIRSVVDPGPDTVLFDVRIELRGLAAASTDGGRAIASDVSYAVDVRGAAGDAVTVEPFDIVTHPTTHADPLTTGSTSSGSITVTGDGFGPLATAAAGALLLLLARRRR